MQKLRQNREQDWQFCWQFVQTPHVQETLQRVLMALAMAKDSKKSKL